MGRSLDLTLDQQENEDTYILYYKETLERQTFGLEIKAAHAIYKVAESCVVQAPRKRH